MQTVHNTVAACRFVRLRCDGVGVVTANLGVGLHDVDKANSSIPRQEYLGSSRATIVLVLGVTFDVGRARTRVSTD
jgi:hypothetical protein